MYCGVDVVVRDAIRSASAAQIPNLLKLARTARDAGNFPEAYSYYNRVLECDADNADAWFGKGETAGWMSSPQAFRLPEMLAGLQQAISHTPESERQAKSQVVAGALHTITTRAFQLEQQHIEQFLATPDAWQGYLNHCWIMLQALDQAHKYAPQDKAIMGSVVEVCDTLIRGAIYIDPSFRNNKGIPIRVPRTISGEYAEKVRSVRQYYALRMWDGTPVYQVQQSRPSSGVSDVFKEMVRGVEKVQAWGFLPSSISPVAILITAALGLFVLLGVAGALADRNEKALRASRATSNSQAVAATSSADSSAAASTAPAEISGSQRLAEAKKALADGYSPNKDPMKTNWGKVAEARKQLEDIKPDVKEYAEAQKLMKEVERREAEINRMSQMVARDIVAGQMEKKLLSEGMDATVTVAGPEKTTITFKYVLFSRPLVYKLTNETEFLQNMRDAGFRKVIFTDGYYNTWTYDL